MTGRAGALALVALVVLAGCGAFTGSPDATTTPATTAETGTAGQTDAPTDEPTTTWSDRPTAGPGETPRIFEEVGAEVGVDVSPTGRNIGSGYGGAFVADYDRDHREDLLLVDNSPILYRNTGDGFERSAALPDADVLENRLFKSALFFDYDNDGWEDLVLIPVGGEIVFLENQRGEFAVRDVGLGAHLDWGMGATAGDYDGDGCLDLFVVQIGNWSTEGVPDRGLDGKVQLPDNGNENLLFRGNCSSFERVTDAGISGAHWSNVASFADFDGDGDPDIHVGNDYYYDAYYENLGNGTFARSELPNSNRHAMASDVEDVNGDGHLDLFVTNVEFPSKENVWLFHDMIGNLNVGNNLFVNRGNGTFEDRATDYHVRYAGGWAWSGNLLDLDNDGDHDLITAMKNYLLMVGDDRATEMRLVRTRPSLWLYEGGTFVRQDSKAAGLGTQDGRGLVGFDYDLDGDQDVVVSNISGPFRFYENVLDDGAGNWLDVHAEGVADQTPVGTEVYVTVDGETRFKLQNAKANFFSQNTRYLHFGLGDTETVESVRVVYPDGTEHVVEDVSANQRLVVGYDGSVEYLSADGNG